MRKHSSRHTSLPLSLSCSSLVTRSITSNGALASNSMTSTSMKEDASSTFRLSELRWMLSVLRKQAGHSGRERGISGFD